MIAFRVRCRALRCRRLRRLTRELCDACWTRVPRELRREILRLADRGDLGGRDARRLAELVNEAIRLAGEGMRA